jgi:hypothetical protein
MSHPEQRDFIREVMEKFPEYFDSVKVLEVGSLDINGSVRDFFTDCEYVGVDLGEGPGVDMIAEGQDLNFSDGFFSTVISAECFEHNPFWRETFENMHRMSRGLVIVTAATTGRVEHGTHRSMPHASPLTLDKWDYYANITEEDLLTFPLDEMFLMWDIQIDLTANDIYFWGITRRVLENPLNNNSSVISYMSKKLDHIRKVEQRKNLELLEIQESKSWRYTKFFRVVKRKTISIFENSYND